MNYNAAVKFISDLFNEIWTALDPFSREPADFHRRNVMLEKRKKGTHYKKIVDLLSYIKQRHPTITHESLDVLADDDKIIVLLKKDCAPKKNEKNILYITIAMYEIRNNKILNTWSCLGSDINYFN